MDKDSLDLCSANKISASIVKSPMTATLSTASAWSRIAKQIHCRDLCTLWEWRYQFINLILLGDFQESCNELVNLDSYTSKAMT